MTDLRAAAQQALEALEIAADHYRVYHDHPGTSFRNAITALRAALTEQAQPVSGSCIACGNRITGSTEHFVVATASVGVTAPEDYSPQRVKAPHFQKEGDSLSPPSEQAQPVQEPVAYIHIQGNYGEISDRPLLDDEKARGWTEMPLYIAPPRRTPLTDVEISQAFNDIPQSFSDKRAFARAIEAAHGIGGEGEA